VVLLIDDESFNKPADQACSHMVERGGCKIHAQRPSVCHDWHCAWRFMGQLGDEWRPDQSGVLLRSDEEGIIFQPIRDPKAVLTTERAIELIGGGVAQGVPLSMSIPTQEGFRSFGMSLNEHLSAVVESRHFPSIKAKIIELIEYSAAQKTAPLERKIINADQDSVFHRAH
jgi:hypothetical protein